jgi:hypothetical protein
MSLDPAVLMASLFVGTLGMALLVYGKKQARVPQMATGTLLLFISYLVPSAFWMMASGAILMAVLWLAVARLGW